MTRSMLDDKRPIEGVYYNDEDGGCYRVGKSCTKIEVYGEPSESCYVPWIAIYDGNNIIARIPSRMVEIVYVKELK